MQQTQAILTQLEPIATSETGYTIVVACLASICLGFVLGHFLAIVYSINQLHARIDQLNYIISILKQGGNHDEPS